MILIVLRQVSENPNPRGDARPFWVRNRARQPPTIKITEIPKGQIRPTTPDDPESHVANGIVKMSRRVVQLKAKL